MIYLPLSRNKLGFARDALFLLPARLQQVPFVRHLRSGGYDEILRRVVVDEEIAVMTPNGVPDTGATSRRPATRGTVKAALLQRADILALPTYCVYEPHPLVWVERMSGVFRGLPEAA